MKVPRWFLGRGTLELLIVNELFLLKLAEQKISANEKLKQKQIIKAKGLNYHQQ